MPFTTVYTYSYMVVAIMYFSMVKEASSDLLKTVSKL